MTTREAAKIEALINNKALFRRIEILLGLHPFDDVVTGLASKARTTRRAARIVVEMAEFEMHAREDAEDLAELSRPL